MKKSVKLKLFLSTIFLATLCSCNGFIRSEVKFECATEIPEKND